MSKPTDLVQGTLDLLILKILALGTRRGPATEARTLYEDLSAPLAPAPEGSPGPARERGSGRPTKAERRALDRLIGED